MGFEEVAGSRVLVLQQLDGTFRIIYGPHVVGRYHPNGKTDRGSTCKTELPIEATRKNRPSRGWGPESQRRRSF